MIPIRNGPVRNSVIRNGAMAALMAGLLGGCVSVGSRTYQDPQQTGSAVRPVCQSGSREQTLVCAGIMAQQAAVRALSDD